MKRDLLTLHFEGGGALQIVTKKEMRDEIRGVDSYLQAESERVCLQIGLRDDSVDLARIIDWDLREDAIDVYDEEK